MKKILKTIVVCLVIIGINACDKGATISAWFTITDIESKTFIFEELKSTQGNVSYLLLGDTKAFMFDTGTGENQSENGFKIKPAISEITSLPITLLLSHFHFDHNQNIAEFDKVAFPAIPFLQTNTSSDSLYTFTAQDLNTGVYPAQVKVNEWLPLNTDIDLGNRIIQVVNIPGHTKESIALIDKTNKIAFLGDYLYNGTLFVFGRANLSPYEQSVDNLISILSSDYRLFGAHGTPEMPFATLQKLKSLLQCIANNSCQPIATTIDGLSVQIYEYQGMEIAIF